MAPNNTKGMVLLRNVRRIRHLSQISIRSVFHPSVVGCDPLNLWFELSHDGRVLYSSQVYYDTFNPDWRHIDFPTDDPYVMYGTIFTLKVFFRRHVSTKWINSKISSLDPSGPLSTEIPNSDTMIEKWSKLRVNKAILPAVDLENTPKEEYIDTLLLSTTDLNLLTLERIQASDMNSLKAMPRNTVLFFLADGIYVFPVVKDYMFKKKLISQETYLADDNSEIHDISTILNRINNIRSIQLNEKNVLDDVKDLETEINCMLKLIVPGEEIQVSSNEELIHLRKLYNDESEKLKEEEDIVINMRNEMIKRGKLLLKQTKSLQTEKEQFIKNEEINAQNLNLKKSDIMLSFRRRKMIIDLMKIYPIRAPSKIKKRKFFMIRGVPLPTNNLTSYDEELIGTALGYSAHLVELVASVLSIKLRYRIIFFGSRSWICDDYRYERMPEEVDTKFPLHYRNADERRFEIGVLLLSKNIEQLLVARVKNWVIGEKRNYILDNLRYLLNEESKLVNITPVPSSSTQTVSGSISITKNSCK